MCGEEGNTPHGSTHSCWRGDEVVLVVMFASKEGGRNMGIEAQLSHSVSAPQVLKPGGRDEAVTSDNRLQFVHLAAEWHLGSRLGPPAEAFTQGLQEVRRSKSTPGGDFDRLPTLGSPECAATRRRVYNN